LRASGFARDLAIEMIWVGKHRSAMRHRLIGLHGLTSVVIFRGSLCENNWRGFFLDEIRNVFYRLFEAIPIRSNI
jgi:hypothetical protein